MNYQDAKDRLARVRTDNAAAVSRHQEHVGRQLASLNPKDLSAADLENLQSQVRERIIVLLEERRRLGVIIQLRADLQKVNGQLQEVERDRESVQADATSLYPAFGAIVRAMTSVDGLPDSCRDLWSRVESAEEKETDLRTRLAEFDRMVRSGPVVKKAVLAGKATFLKGKHRVQQRRVLRLQTLLGECVFHSDGLAGMPSIQDDAAVGQVAEARARLDALDGQTTKLERRRETLLAKLLELGGAEPAAKRETALTQKKLEIRISELHTELGRLYVGQPLDALVKGRDLEKALDRIKELESFDSKCEELENRLAAALEVDRARDLVEDSQRQIEMLRSDIQRRETEIERLDGQIGSLQKKADHEAQIRGAVDSLVSEVDAVLKSRKN